MNFEDLLGVSWVKGGRDAKGLDCYGLAMEVRRRIGDPIPEYNSPDEENSIVSCILKEMDFAEKLDTPVPYCFIAIKLFSPYVNHMGIVLEDCDHFIHIIRGETVSIDRISSFHWKNRIVGFYKWKSNK